MTKRSQRAQIASDTLAILDKGKYATTSGRIISVREAFNFALKHSVLYCPESFLEVFQNRDQLLTASSKVPTKFEVRDCTTLEAARQLCAVDSGLDVFCLNFASAKHPGGGVLGGSQAQEESLARSTGLYPCIAQMTEMYETNKVFGSCLYTDHMIYSPKVPVLRDDEGNLLEHTYSISILTSPAVNAGAVKPNERNQIERVMLQRMEKILSLAVIHGHHTLILGAWGCGVFKNEPGKVAEWFHKHLVQGITFKGIFQKVIFAISDSSEEKRFIQPFTDRFITDKTAQD